MSVLHLLCVDDDKDILEIVRLALCLDPDIEVRTAQDGPEALKLLMTADWMVHCILLDMRMPGEDGRTLLGEIRTIPWHADTPVIFVTASVRPSDVAEVKALGAHGVIAKPFDPLRLGEMVRTALKQPT